MKTINAVEEILAEDPQTRDNKYLWMFLLKVLRKLGVNAYVDFSSKKLPSPDSLLSMRRQILNKKNRFPTDFVPEEGVTYLRNEN